MLGGAALRLNGRALPPAVAAEVTLCRVSSGDAYAYTSAEPVAAVEGARFEVLAGEEVAAEGVFLRRRGGEGWRVECRRAPVSASASVCVAEVVVLTEGGVLMQEVERRTEERVARRGRTAAVSRRRGEAAPRWGKAGPRRLAGLGGRRSVSLLRPRLENGSFGCLSILLCATQSTKRVSRLGLPRCRPSKPLKFTMAYHVKARSGVQDMFGFTLSVPKRT
ncbi:uncharacterized protein [Miscanthus floridulus]|uniref:uncharacterized protein n=1 Tax=Miscanthus floridulus TaxID=154761 RepID=UPI00345ADA19